MKKIAEIYTIIRSASSIGFPILPRNSLPALVINGFEAFQTLKKSKQIYSDWFQRVSVKNRNEKAVVQVSAKARDRKISAICRRFPPKLGKIHRFEPKFYRHSASASSSHGAYTPDCFVGERDKLSGTFPHVGKLPEGLIIHRRILARSLFSLTDFSATM